MGLLQTDGGIEKLRHEVQLKLQPGLSVSRNGVVFDFFFPHISCSRFALDRFGAVWTNGRLRICNGKITTFFTPPQRKVHKFTILWLERAIKQAQNHQERSAWVVAAALPLHKEARESQRRPPAQKRLINPRYRSTTLTAAPRTRTMTTGTETAQEAVPSRAWTEDSRRPSRPTNCTSSPRLRPETVTTPPWLET